MKLLHVDASARFENSHSRRLSRYFVDGLKERIPDLSIDYLDLARNPPAHVTELFTAAMYTPPAERTQDMAECLKESDELCRRVLGADALVFATPMYNFSLPSTFKAFIDNIVRGGVTYIPTPDGQFIGQLARHKVLFITTRGVDLRPESPWSQFDALTPALRAAFGFMGVADPHFIDAQPLQFSGPEAKEAALIRAHEALDATIEDWASAFTPAATK